MRIRPAGTSDARAIAAILCELGWFASLPDDLDAASRQVEARVPDPEDLVRTTVVAEGDVGEVAGYAHWTVTHALFLPGPSLYLTELFVAAERRGSGVGSALLDHLHRHRPRRPPPSRRQLSRSVRDSGRHRHQSATRQDVATLR